MAHSSALLGLRMAQKVHEKNQECDHEKNQSKKFVHPILSIEKCSLFLIIFRTIADE